MFNSISDDPKNQLLSARLSRLTDDIRKLELSTREEYQAEVYSRVNAILALGVGMTPLSSLTPEGPAILGDLVENLTRLNRDGADIASQILATEDVAARLFNLAASSQNSLRQQIRELVLSSNDRRYVQPFIDPSSLDSSSLSVDADAGVAVLPITQETEVKPTITVGLNSIGTQVSGPEFLTDNSVETSMVWEGPRLELLLKFDSPKIVNRIKISMDDYQGLEILELETSPDGTYVENILNELNVRSLHLNGIQSKYSGDFVIDFDPKHCTTIRILIEDRVDVARIALRSLTILSRQFANVGRLITKKIDAPSGRCLFTTTEKSAPLLTSITHQISYNGVHFSVIKPGDTIALQSSPFWYSAVLERSTSQFENASSPLAVTATDPITSPNYTLASSKAISLGAGILERTLVFQVVRGPIVLKESPLPDTLMVQEGSVLLAPTDYAFSGNILSFPTQRGSITVTYQTSSLGPAAIKLRQNYYTPLLYEARFEKVG